MKGILWLTGGIAYLLFVAVIPWLPGIDTDIFGIPLRIHSAGNLTIGLLWLLIVLFLFIPRFRSLILEKYYLLDSLSPRHIRRIIWAITGIIFIISTSYKLRAHYNFQTHACDFGIYATLFWNTVNGRIMWSSLSGFNYLGHHLNLLVIPSSVLFLLWKNAAVLLVLSSAVIALSIPAVYEIARLLKFRISTCFVSALAFSNKYCDPPSNHC